MEIQRTRQALGSQIREALDDMVAKGTIRAYGLGTGADGRLYYTVHSAVTTSLGRTPGEMADWLNRHGYDIRFGKV